MAMSAYYGSMFSRSAVGGAHAGVGGPMGVGAVDPLYIPHHDSKYDINSSYNGPAMSSQASSTNTSGFDSPSTGSPSLYNHPYFARFQPSALESFAVSSSAAPAKQPLYGGYPTGGYHGHNGLQVGVGQNIMDDLVNCNKLSQDIPLTLQGISPHTSAASTGMMAQYSVGNFGSMGAMHPGFSSGGGAGQNLAIYPWMRSMAGGLYSGIYVLVYNYY